MESTVLSLSRSEATEKKSNSEWTTRLSQAVTVNEGDYIMIKQAFIDTRLINSNSILIEKDVEWTLQFMYWVNNIGINAKYQDANGDLSDALPDGLPYMLMNYSNDVPAESQLRPMIDDFTIKIPAGIYERSFLAEYISRQLQGIQQPPNRKFYETTFSKDTVHPIYDSSNNFTGFSTPTPPTAGITPITSFQRPVWHAEYFSGTPPPTNQDGMYYKNKQNGLVKCFFYRMTDSEYYNIWDKGYTVYDGTVFGTFPTNGAEYRYRNGNFIGATEVSFVYNEDGSGKFAFNYAHSPLINNGNESVGTVTIKKVADTNLNDCRTVYMGAYSGIMFVNSFTNLSDDPNNDPFFEQLGMKITDFVPVDEVKKFFAYDNGGTHSPTHFFNYEAFLKYTTRNKMTLGSLTTSKTVDLVSGDDSVYKLENYQPVYLSLDITTPHTGNYYKYYFETSNVTEPIRGSMPPISSNYNGGHYLVDLQCPYVNNFITQNKTFQVKSIVGNYFLSGDSFAMSMGPDSYIYQHKGEPISLQSFKVRILNPITKEPESILGENSTIYLQVTREPLPSK